MDPSSRHSTKSSKFHNVQLSKHALKERFHGWQLCWKVFKTVCSDGTPPKATPSLNVGVQLALFCIVPQIALAMHKGSVKKGRREEVQLNSQSLRVYCEFVSAALLCSKIGKQKDMSSTATGRHFKAKDPSWCHVHGPHYLKSLRSKMNEPWSSFQII